MNQIVVTSAILRKHFEMMVIPFRFSSAIHDIERITLRKIVGTFALAFRILRCCLIKRPALVYFTLSPRGIGFKRDLLFVAVLKILRLNVVYHLHGKGIRAEASKSLNALVYDWVFRESSVIQLSTLLYPDISQFVRKHKCYFIPNGIPDPQRKAYGIIKGQKDLTRDPKILFLSSMAIAKGPLVLLEALGRLKEKAIHFKAVFAGQWYSDNCRQLFYDKIRHTAFSDSIFYLGPKYNDEKSGLYEDADIFVFPTLNDAFGLVLLEAMGHGLPVVASKDGGIPDIVEEGVTGFLVPPGDANVLADRLALLIKDRELRERFGQAGLKRFHERFTKDTFEKNLLNILQSCLANSRS